MSLGWLKTVAVAAFVLSGVAAKADDMADWRKNREAKFATYQAARPKPEAKIETIKARTAAMVAAYKPGPFKPKPKYAGLRAKSAALSLKDRAKAQQIFDAAFKQWLDGNYAAAKDGYAKGLAIDPANGVANYYMADILLKPAPKLAVAKTPEANAPEAPPGPGPRAPDLKPMAASYMDRAATFASDTAEGSKAVTALRGLPPLENDPNLERPPVIWRAGKLEFWEGAEFPEMVVIPAGEYTMGSALTEPNRKADEGPRHRITIAYPLAVSKYAVTLGEFAAFVADSHYDTGDVCNTHEDNEWKDREGRSWKYPAFKQTDSEPVVCMDYKDAQAYAAWLSKKTGHSYRLLSESEYEYANRAGTTTAYWWGDTIGGNHANCPSCGNVRDFEQTVPVGTFPPNPFGLYETTGNAWSWVADCTNPNYDNEPTDGAPNMTGNCGSHMLRSGAWYYIPGSLRSAIRDRNSRRNYHNGFRVARVL